jgi:hypothetical protein
MVMRHISCTRLIAACAVAAVLSVWSPCPSAEIYKWVDQKGVTNYSSAPPATGKARALDPGATTVSVYPTMALQDAARLDAIMRQKVAMLENQLRAERQARLTQQASYRTDAGLAYEQCLRERRVDCDSGRDGMRATPYFYAAAAPVYVVGRPFPSTPFPITPFTPFPRTPPPAFATMARFSQPPVVSARTAGHRALSRKFR